jgi:hypothetical protein
MSLPLVGWKERLDFPEWGLHRLRAKIDTGARTSALHAERYTIEETDAGLFVRLLLDLAPQRHEAREVLVPVVRLASVRSSNGVRERRPVIAVQVNLGGVTERVEFTLTNRARMRFRIILGRGALANRFHIDPSRAYLLPRPRRQKD